MNKKTVFIKTAKGESEGGSLSVDLKRVLSLIDNKSTLDELGKRAPPSLRDELGQVLSELVAGEYIRDRDQPQVESRIVTPKITQPRMAIPKPPAPSSDELDFTAGASNKQDVIARARDELEAAVAAAKAKSNAEAAAKAEAKARQEAERAARAKAAEEANALAEAQARAKLEAAARMRAEQEAAARARAEQEAAHARALQDAAARSKAEAEAKVRAEIEAAVRAKQEAEAKARREAEEALRAEQEAARIKAELEAAAKARAAAEAEAARVKAELEAAKARAEAEAKARQEAEAARIKAEQEAEAARIKAAQEAEAARVRAEQEAEAVRIKAEQEAVARAKAEAEARAKKEAEAARIKAEQEAAARAKAQAEERTRQEAAARAKAEAEARARQEAEAKARREAEEALRAEQEAARVKAEQEAAERSRTARPETEAEARERAAEEEAALLLAEYERQVGGGKPKAKAEPVAPPPAPSSAPAPAKTEAGFEIKLDAFRAQPEPVAAPAAQEAPVPPPAPNRPAQEADTSRKTAAADEMARLKAEAEAAADAARRRAEEEARRQAEEKALAEEQARAWAEAEQRAQVQARIEAEQVAQQATVAQAKSSQKAPRARRAPLPWGKIVTSLFVLALLVAIVLPYVYPMQEFVAPIEQRLAAQLRQPVKIGGLSAATFPPQLQLSNVTLGNAQEVKVGSAVLKFAPLGLLSEVRPINSLELKDVSIDGKRLDSQLASLKTLGGDRKYPVHRMTLQNIRIISDEVSLPVFGGIAEIDEQGNFSRIAVHSDDDKYSIDLQPYQGSWQLAVSLKETKLPLLPGIVFSDLSAKGVLGEGEVNFSEMDAHIFNGILLGNGKLKWSKGWQLQGRLEAKLFEVKKMFPEYGLEGELSGDGTFSFSSDKLAQLGASPRLEASFTVKRGIISGIDMVETARLGSREHLMGGRTHFDDLIGTAQLENGTTRFRQIRIVSGMLSARGTFDVTQDKRMAGSFNAEIKMREGDNLLTLFGTLTEPRLRAGR